MTLRRLIGNLLLFAAVLFLPSAGESAQPPDPPPSGYAFVYRGGICVADGSGNCVGGDIKAEAGVGSAVGYMKTSASAGTIPVSRSTCYSDSAGNCTGWGLSLDVNGTPVGYLATSAPNPPNAGAPLTQAEDCCFRV